MKIKRSKQWARGELHLYTWSGDNVLYTYYQKPITEPYREPDRLYTGHSRYDAENDKPCPRNWIIA